MVVDLPAPFGPRNPQILRFDHAAAPYSERACTVDHHPPYPAAAAD